jgi:hypothetical protein
MKRIAALAAIVLLISCETPTIGPPANPSQAYIPVYMQVNEIEKISVEGPRATAVAGKIYVFGNLLLQNDINTGIHLIDASNPASPKKIGFLKIPLCTEMAIKDGYLYANNNNDIVVIDLRNNVQPSLVKRMPGVFPAISQQHPPFTNVLFECPDPAKGIVVSWELKSNPGVKCRR